MIFERPRGRRGPRRLQGPAIACLAWLFGLAVLSSGCEFDPAQDRARGLAQVGESIGLRPLEALPEAERMALRALPAIRSKQRSFFVNALGSADAGGRVRVFDWTWTEGDVKRRERVSQTVVAIVLPERRFPAFVWTGRGALTRKELAGLGGVIEFPEAVEFDDAYWVAGRDRPAIRRIFTADRLHGLQLSDGLRVEAAGDWLIGYRPSLRVEPETLPAFVEEMSRLAERLNVSHRAQAGRSIP